MIVRPDAKIIQELDASSFTAIGSPGSDGHGGEALQTFAQALAGAKGDFVVVLGDVAPLGRDPYYENIANFIDNTSLKPVYVMPGNHDGPDYDSYFGCADRAIFTSTFTLIMLDNSRRRFSDETLTFLRDTLALADSPNVVVAFHVPPPNRFSGNSLTKREWARFEEAAGVWRKRISLLLAGHAHTYFEDEVDGLRLIVTGGGGARLQQDDRVAVSQHHVAEFKVREDGMLRGVMRPLGSAVGRETRILERFPELEDAFAAECRAHVNHSIDAEEAERKGLVNLARMLRAAAQSRLLHARNLRRLLKQHIGGPLTSIAASLDESRRQAEHAKRNMKTLGPKNFLAANALHAVSVSEEACTKLFESATGGMGSGHDIPPVSYYVCFSCGHLYQGYESPTYCSLCGAPADSIQTV